MNAPPAVPTTAVAGPRPWVRRAAILAVALVGLSVMRPWGDGASPRPAVQGDLAARRDDGREFERADAAASPAPSLAPDEIACSRAGWQLVSLDRLGTWTVRSWMPAAAVRAEDPLDPSIRPITLDSPEVLGVGACSPPIVDAAGGRQPGGPALVVRAWRIDAHRATPVALATRRNEATPGVATLYQPRAAASAGRGSAEPAGRPAPWDRATPDAAPSSSWPPGRFVLELAPAGARAGEPARTDPDARASRAWFMSLVIRDPR